MWSTLGGLRRQQRRTESHHHVFRFRQSAKRQPERCHLFQAGGTLSGNLDGGPGTDTLYYQTGMLTGSDVINLPADIAPRVSGQALNIESTNTFGALTISNPGSLLVQVDAPLTPVTITATGGAGTKMFSATGLPTGVAIDPATGVISGTNTTEYYSANVVVTVTDDTGSVSTNFRLEPH